MKCGVMLYQSVSGDAEVGTSVFTWTEAPVQQLLVIYLLTEPNAVFKLIGVNLPVAQESPDSSADRWGTRV
jgi:hypothetical protein